MCFRHISRALCKEPTADKQSAVSGVAELTLYGGGGDDDDDDGGGRDALLSAHFLLGHFPPVGFAPTQRQAQRRQQRSEISP